ncbi:transporter substrate-binding domain-containing protein [Roseomonas indoligenes]|uniref:Transporter substrate-binding domain-containing protein n=1 Tax=Roseomonas indoligenes TaxID=2820811 RepID=A0A940S7X0_9PROT|nr:transporter substrate-binding domain-containing protein [Pararoseomonas indoligenes]MBP0495494.1 transporter substrate-binding domain-containing protein [Pararoseomonas indoligenes]
MNRRSLLALAPLLPFAAVPARAQPAAVTLDAIKRRGKLLIAMDTNNPPWGMLDTSMQPDGYDITAGKMLAQDLGVPMELVPVTSQNRIPFILTGKADLVMATLTITPQRAEQILFSKPYCAQESVIMAPQATEIRSFEDLRGKRVSVVRGAIQDPIVVEKAPGAVMMRYDNDASTIQALMSRQVDACATGFLIPAQTNRLQPGRNYEKKLSLGTQMIGIGMRHGSEELHRAVNGFIDKAKADGRLAEAFKRYTGVDLLPLADA